MVHNSDPSGRIGDHNQCFVKGLKPAFSSHEKLGVPFRETIVTPEWPSKWPSKDFSKSVPYFPLVILTFHTKHFSLSLLVFEIFDWITLDGPPCICYLNRGFLLLYIYIYIYIYLSNSATVSIHGSFSFSFSCFLFQLLIIINYPFHLPFEFTSSAAELAPYSHFLKVHR